MLAHLTQHRRHCCKYDFIEKFNLKFFLTQQDVVSDRHAPSYRHDILLSFFMKLQMITSCRYFIFCSCSEARVT